MKNLFCKRNIIILIILLLISLSFGCTKEEKLQGTAYDIESGELIILGELEDIIISSLSNPESGNFVLNGEEVIFSAEKIRSDENNGIIYKTYEGVASIENEDFHIDITVDEKGLNGMISTEKPKELKFGFFISDKNTEDVINRMKSDMDA